MMSKSLKVSASASIRAFEVASLTDHLNTPSSRFRIRQHVEKLALQGINVTDLPRIWSTESAGALFPDKKIRSSIPKFLVAGAFEVLNLGNSFFRTLKSQCYDSVWISRELVIGYPTFEKMVRHPFFYDIDDAIFLDKSQRVSGIKQLIEGSAATFAGNQYLVDFCKQYSSKVFNVATAVDVDRFIPVMNKLENRKFVFGWSGTSSSYKFFKPIEGQLAEFFKVSKGAILKICSDKFPHELSKLAPYIQFEFWNPENEVSQIQSFDVGIMPLENSEWVKGKCSYKMLLYASCGIPTITDAYGMNKDVLTLGRLGIGCENATQWRDALDYIYNNRDYLVSIFPDCRKVVLENFSLNVISGRISKEMRAALEY